SSAFNAIVMLMTTICMVLIGDRPTTSRGSMPLLGAFMGEGYHGVFAREHWAPGYGQCRAGPALWDPALTVRIEGYAPARATAPRLHRRTMSVTATMEP